MPSIYCNTPDRKNQKVYAGHGGKAYRTVEEAAADAADRNARAKAAGLSVEYVVGDDFGG